MRQNRLNPSEDFFVLAAKEVSKTLLLTFVLRKVGVVRLGGYIGQFLLVALLYVLLGLLPITLLKLSRLIVMGLWLLLKQGAKAFGHFLLFFAGRV